MNVFRLGRRPTDRTVRRVACCVFVAVVLALAAEAVWGEDPTQPDAAPATSNYESPRAGEMRSPLPDQASPPADAGTVPEQSPPGEERANSGVRLCTSAANAGSKSGPPPTSNVSPADAESQNPLRHPDCVRMAQSDPVELLRLAKASYEASVRDYTVTFTRQERGRDGHLQPAETMHCKFRRAPFNVFLKWQQGAGRIDRALYAPTLLGPEILVHPTGLAGLLAPVVRIDLEGKHADSARQIRDFGFASALDRLIQRGLLAQTRHELNTTFLGETTVGGRAAIGVQWRLPPARDHQYGRIVVHLCRQTLLPLTVALWDCDEELQAKYIYENLQLNVGLTDDDFSTASCGLGG